MNKAHSALKSANSSGQLPEDGPVPFREFKIHVEYLPKKRRDDEEPSGFKPYTAIAYAGLDPNDTYTKRAQSLLCNQETEKKINDALYQLLQKELPDHTIDTHPAYLDFVVAGDVEQKVKNLLQRTTAALTPEGEIMLTAQPYEKQHMLNPAAEVARLRCNGRD